MRFWLKRKQSARLYFPLTSVSGRSLAMQMWKWTLEEQTREDRYKNNNQRKKFVDSRNCINKSICRLEHKIIKVEWTQPPWIHKKCKTHRRITFKLFKIEHLSWRRLKLWSCIFIIVYICQPFVHIGSSKFNFMYFRTENSNKRFVYFMD